jgi:hypothetical protein
VGIGPEDGIAADFYVMSSNSLSTFSKEEAEELDAAGVYTIEDVLEIPLRSVNSIIKENFDEPPDLVSIDVEGWNEQIIDSFDFTQSRPFCFCVETITFSDSYNGVRLTKIIDVLKANDYVVYADTHINTIFVNRAAFK